MLRLAQAWAPVAVRRPDATGRRVRRQDSISRRQGPVKGKLSAHGQCCQEEQRKRGGAAKHVNRRDNKSVRPNLQAVCHFENG